MDLDSEAWSLGDGTVDIRPISGAVSMAGEVVTGTTVLRSAGPDASVVSMVDAVLCAPVHVGEGVDLSRCDFSGAVGLEHLRLSRACFARRSGRFVVDGASGSVLRQLRTAAQRSRLWTLADDLHIGELDAARRAAPPHSARRAWPSSSGSWAGTGIARRVRSPRTS